MPKLLINETQEIFNLFKKRLDKIEALYLFGYYYAKCSTYDEDDITKNIIIAQQFLTYLQRNSYSSLDKDDFVKDLFYDDNDDIDDNCHPDFQVPDQEDIDIAKIQNNIPFFNDMLEIPLVFDIPQIETKIEKPEEEIFEDEKDVPQEQDNLPEVYTESKNASDTVNKFLSYFPAQTKKQKKKYPRALLEMKVGNGRFTQIFLNESFHVYALEEDKEKLDILKRRPFLFKLENYYLECPEESSLDAIWSYSATLQMKKDEVLQVLKNMEIGLVDHGVAFISFLYGTGYKTSNGTTYVLQTENSFRDLLAKTKNLEIQELWKSTYVKRDGTESSRLNVILKKKPGNLDIQIFDEATPIDDLPKSLEIQKIQLISRKTNILQPEIDTEYEQRLTIAKDGRIWFTRYKVSDNSDGIETEILEKKIVSISKDDVEKIFFIVYRSVFLIEKEYLDDAGEWELIVTASCEDIYKTRGSMGIPIFFRNKEVNEILRESIPVEGLWIFDNPDE